MIYWRTPRLWILADQRFHEPPWMPVNWLGQEPAEGEKIVEFAGRLCYMSQANESGKTNAEYIANMIEKDHSSVNEHAVITLLIEGVSRSCSHEVVRHRHHSPSQLSQRYVSWHLDAVIPPAVQDLGEEAIERWKEDHDVVMGGYNRQWTGLKKSGLKGKVLAETARSLLPNACETKMVLTGNATAWRHLIKKRRAEGADAEMRRLAQKILEIMHGALPSIFVDMK